MSAKKKETNKDDTFPTTGGTKPAKKVARKVAKKVAKKPAAPKNDLFQLPTASSGLGPGGVPARDAKIRDEKIQRQRRATIRKLDRQIRFNSGRRGNPNLLAALNAQKKSLGGDLLNVGSVGIPNTKDLDNQARIDSDDQARKRWKIAQAQAGKNQAKNGGGGQPAGGGGQPAGGEGQAEDEVEEEVGVLGYDRNPPERESQREAREATERSTESGVFGDQKKQEAFGERFGHGARDTKQKFLDDLEESDLIKVSRGLGEYDRNPNSKEVKDAQEKAYKRADELGVTREELQVKMGWETDAEAAEETRKASAIRDVQEKAEQKQRISDEFDADLEDRIERMKADPGYKPLISQEIHDILDPKRIQELQDETDSSVKEARTNTEMVEARSHLQMEEVRNKIARKKKIREEQKQEQEQGQEQEQEQQTKFNESFEETRTVLPSNPRGGTKPKEVTTSSYSKVRNEALRGAVPGTSMQGMARVRSSQKAQDEIISKAIKSNHSLENDKELMALPGFASRYKKAKKEKRDQASRSLKKEVADASKPAQQQ